MLKPNPDVDLNADKTIKRGRLHCVLKHEIIATGLYPQISLLNHSCDPNIRNRFDRLSLTIFAKEKIDINQEILNCYCPDYLNLEPQKRRKTLRDQYYFECSCKRCLLDAMGVANCPLRTYVCQNCNEMIILKQTKANWWHKDTSIDSIICNECNYLFDTKWYDNYVNSIEHFQNGSSTLNQSINSSYNIYQNSKQTMLIENDQLMDMAKMFLQTYLTEIKLESKQAKKYYKMLMTVAREFLEAQKIRYTVYSLEYLSAITYLFDIMAMTKEQLFESDVKMELMKDFDIAKSVLSIDIAPIYLKYLEMYCV